MHSHANNYGNFKSRNNDIDDDSSDDNGNDQWTPDTDADGKDDFVKDYSSDPDEIRIKKKRIRKKGRKAKFLVEQLIYDQQIMANQQRLMQYQQQQQIQLPIAPQPSIHYPQQTFTSNIPHSLPTLESVGANHIPGSFDLVPRG
ncbi:hypothetical protein TVAG_210100 [Trichomonas vaginalis G3]|uniref:Uncharacterized protein n=1 Tax=Trichomonas vaginalis (strain ATCC PRA-98 / G3) TaxID=412133 RepID=A2DVR7_TRIV3|nr:hypothetical protein TVAGG3_0734610 [Trichomonas vaginalis G3]EAY15480.1 hypothetical protein TVAG_210100 [Trichomonas vaginalis G3]KAI5511490.1 hypothetical protein TVAGG3_0734610 [Trichomonas vaginalis G3]|eukprot:XP_001327703.1 hypothetical protein [Trichomonas vaginalis G3]